MQGWKICLLFFSLSFFLSVPFPFFLFFPAGSFYLPIERSTRTVLVTVSLFCTRMVKVVLGGVFLVFFKFLVGWEVGRQEGVTMISAY